MSFKSKALIALVNEQLAFLQLKPLNLRKLSEDKKRQLFAECKLISGTETFNAIIDLNIEQFKDRIIKDEDADYNRAGLLMLQGLRTQINHLANQYAESQEDEQPSN